MNCDNIVGLGEVATVKGGKRLPKGINLIQTPNTHPYIRVRDITQRKTIQLRQHRTIAASALRGSFAPQLRCDFLK